MIKLELDINAVNFIAKGAEYYGNLDLTPFENAIK